MGCGKVCVFVIEHDRSIPMTGWLLWAVVLPLLLVVAGIITLRRWNQRR